jgi:hypothetical protein
MPFWISSAPGQHLVTDLHAQRMLGHLEVFPDIGIEHLEALELRQVVPARIIEILEAAIAGFISMVVPVLEADERALALAIETEIGEALEHLRNGVALLKVQPVVIGADAGRWPERLAPAGLARVTGFCRGRRRPACRPGSGGLVDSPSLVEVEGGRLVNPPWRREPPAQGAGGCGQAVGVVGGLRLWPSVFLSLLGSGQVCSARTRCPTIGRDTQAMADKK